MAYLASVVRISTRRNAVWRACTACDVLAPLAPNATHCSDCLTAAPRTRRRIARAA
jgi:hypothetical protein